MDDDTKNHTKFLMLYHLIFVCKYRKNRLIRSGDEVKKHFEESAVSSGFSCEAMEVDQDHLHGLVKSELQISPGAIGRKLKQESTFRLWKNYGGELKRHFWKEKTFWSDGYFCYTVGNASQETILHDIESQG